VKVDEFDFQLPPDRIADRPAMPRDSARLLTVLPDRLEDRLISQLPDLLQPGDLMVVNDTRVIPARLQGRRGQAGIEITVHQPLTPLRWLAFARPAKKLAAGDQVIFADDFTATVLAKQEGGEVLLDFSCPADDFFAALQRHGAMPLPPYIKRPKGQDGSRDHSDYQTLFAREPGAVAAPTAGLHFTPTLLEALARRGIERLAVTLHVGAGTFLPVRVADTSQHRMHGERGCLTAEAAVRLNDAKAAGRRILAVGSTALRLLESATDAQGRVFAFDGSTDIFITPGYRFRSADLMLTNFHLPRSTLFMLVAAFAGLPRMHQAYAHAIETGYRFYSYGDATLLQRLAQ